MKKYLGLIASFVLWGALVVFLFTHHDSNINMKKMRGSKLSLNTELAPANFLEAESAAQPFRRTEIFPQDNDVIIGNDQNFDDIAASSKYIFVDFYAPWCPHCQRLEPEWSKVATILKNQGSDIKVVKVDATVNTQLALRFGIDRFPILSLFKEGDSTPTPYMGDRTSEAMANWAKDKTQPAVLQPGAPEGSTGTQAFSQDNDVIIGTDENFDSVAASSKYLLVDFYAPWCPHCQRLEPEWSKAATSLKEQGSDIKVMKVDATVNTQLAIRFGINQFPIMSLFKQGDSNSTPYMGERTSEAIVNWAKDTSK